MAKKYKIIEFIQEEKPEILAITETHLKEKNEFSMVGYDWVG